MSSAAHTIEIVRIFFLFFLLMSNLQFCLGMNEKYTSKQSICLDHTGVSVFFCVNAL